MIEPAIRSISYGAGVQSTAMLLMALNGIITPKPDVAIYADVGWEGLGTATYLKWIKQYLKRNNFPLHIVSAGNIKDEAKGITAIGTKLTATMPMYVVKNGVPCGPTPRQCSGVYKIEPIYRKLRGLIGPHRKDKVAEQWIGFSSDEKRRVAKPRRKWLRFRYPLIEMEMTRADCIDWLNDNGYPVPPKSRCVGCPFRSNKGWEELASQNPAEFAEAVAYEKGIQAIMLERFGNEFVHFLHRSMKPLEEAVVLQPKKVGG